MGYLSVAVCMCISYNCSWNRIPCDSIATFSTDFECLNVCWCRKSKVRNYKVEISIDFKYPVYIFFLN